MVLVSMKLVTAASLALAALVLAVLGCWRQMDPSFGGEMPMKAYVVGKYLGAPKLGDATGLLHDLLFHGRQDKGRFRLADPCLSDHYRPLFLVHNSRWVPEVFMPTISLVVAEAVKEKLSGLPHLAFHPANFTRLIDHPALQPGDFSHYDDPDYVAACEEAAERGDTVHFHERLPDVPELRARLGTYYEVVPARLKDVLPGYPGVWTVTCRMDRAMPRSLTLQLSPELLADYPLVWWYHLVMTAEVLAILGPYLDRNYFEVLEVELGSGQR